jgi:hypothetical protein
MSPSSTRKSATTRKRAAAPAAGAPRPLSADAARARRLQAQGLVGARRQPVPALLEAHGWLRTLGGSEAYVALQARLPGAGRKPLEQALAAGTIQVGPAARGCIYVLPQADAAAALAVAESLTARRAERDAERAGIRRGELQRVADAVLAALERHGPLATDALRRVLPDGTVRSLGEAGKKVGVSSPLPPALRRLEFDGRIERALADGRLDSERYLWRAVRERAPARPDLGRIAERFFGAAGVASLDDFADWSGLAKKDAAALIAKLPLTPVTVEGEPGTQYLAKGHAPDPDAADDVCALLPFEDNLTALHGGMRKFTAPEHHRVPMPAWGRGKGSTIGDTTHPTLRPVVAGGRIAGFWEFDPDRKEVVLGLFSRAGAATQRRLAGLAEELTELLRDLGHAHSFSLDTDDELRRRLASVTRLGSAKAAGRRAK